MTNSACAKNNGDGLLYSILCSYFVRIVKRTVKLQCIIKLSPSNIYDTLSLCLSKILFQIKKIINTYSIKVTNDASRAGPAGLEIK